MYGQGHEFDPVGFASRVRVRVWQGLTLFQKAFCPSSSLLKQPPTDPHLLSLCRCPQSRLEAGAAVTRGILPDHRPNEYSRR